MKTKKALAQVIVLVMVVSLFGGLGVSALAADFNPGCGGGSYSVTISGARSFSVGAAKVTYTNGSGWITIIQQPTTSNGGVCKFTVAKNTGTSSRSANIDITYLTESYTNYTTRRTVTQTATHNMVEDGKATCHVSGTKTCSRCQRSESYKKPHDTRGDGGRCLSCGNPGSDLNAHQYTKTIKEATCAAAGIKQCSIHTCTETATMPATGKHNFTPNCFDREKCTVCGTYGDYPLGYHSYMAATCTSPKTCTNCGVTEGSALGHDLQPSPSYGFQPTCLHSGLGFCTRCGDSGSIPALGHNYSAATCTSPKVCTRCGDAPGEPLGHNFQPSSSYGFQPTCLNSGLGICTRCNTAGSIPALGHDWSASDKCTRCGEIKPPVNADGPPVNTYINRGNFRLDIVEVAGGQLGVKSNKYCIYNDKSMYPKNNPCNKWCADFVYWCARQAGMAPADLPSWSHSVSGFFNSPKINVHKANGSYPPKPGDLIFKSTSSHIGIVTYYDPNTKTVYTIEGNTYGDGNNTYRVMPKKYTNFEKLKAIGSFVRIETQESYNVTLAQGLATLPVGVVQQFSAPEFSSYAPDLLVWSSDNPAVATVDSFGFVTTLDSGTVNIMCSTSGDDFSAFCEVAVMQFEEADWDEVDDWDEVEPPSLTGTVRSYNPNTPATVQLLQNDEVMYETATELDTSAGSGQTDQPFTFYDVAPGDYTLVITKPGHASYTVRTVTVGDEDVDLTPRTRDASGAITLPCGDINGDGMINDGDLAVLWMAANYNKSAGGPEVNELCDLNGDGMVNDGDLAILWMAANYNKGAVVT